MNSQQNFFIIAFLFLSFIIWHTWKNDHSINKSNFKITQQISNANISNFNNHNLKKINHVITIKTDVLLLKINTHGGNIEQAFLLTYPKKLNSSKPFNLLELSKNFIYQVQSGINDKDGPNNSINNKYPLYSSKKDIYILKDNQNEIRVPMTYKTENGIIYIKTFTLKRNSFALNVDYDIINNSDKSIKLTLFCQIEQSINLTKENENNKNFSMHFYRGTAYSTNKEKYKKYSFKDIKRKNLNIYTYGGWIAMLQQYFVTAWVPSTHKNNIFYTKNFDNNQVVIGFKSIPIIITKNTKSKLQTILWIGPKIQDKMKVISPYLDLTVDYGWLWFISQPLFKFLKFINSYINNWGFSIIIITFIMRIIMYPLTKAQYVSIAKIRMIQPKLEAIRKNTNNNKKYQNQEIINLYKKEKINPLGGFLPLIIQMPIFLALYYMLSGSIELRHAPFILWIHDLSSQDPYYILPIIMGITMFLIQKNSPNTINDPTQKQISIFMPMIFTIFFLYFPSGLVLYYIISNIVTIIQQQIIYKELKHL